MILEADFLISSIILGVGATLFMDIWALFMKKAFDMPSLDYALVGRWIGHMPQGKFSHSPIMASKPTGGERPLGWFAHYLIGILFAAALLAVVGHGWLMAPTILPALLTGLLTITMPFLLMQPAFGFGVAASKTPMPNVARLRSLQAHLSFGFGLYLAAIIVGPILYS